MDIIGFLLSNGRSTKSLNTDDLVKTKLACAAPSNYWSISEYNGNNAWNVNFSNGNLNNNNNKYNSNVVRAVAALGEEVKAGWIEAYRECCSNKKSSCDCNQYRMNYELDLWLLIYEVYTQTYVPSASTCFVVTRPKLREVFAAAFRDRIVHHWICARLNPLFERRFMEQGNVSHNCRKGFGTQSAVNALRRDIEQVSRNYTREAWIGRFDVSSFFMSIDTGLLWGLLKPFILANYKGDDIDTLLYLTERVILHRPQDNCIRKSPQWMFNALPEGKTLFRSSTGVPIGNLPSQLFANFLMSYFDEIMVRLCDSMGDDIRFERYVDDFVIVAARVNLIIGLRPLITRTFRNALHLKLHPNKMYLQQGRKGIAFVGSVIKDERSYISNRTVGNMTVAFSRLDAICKECVSRGISINRLAELRHRVDSINSYLGFTVHYNAYNIRKRLFAAASKEFWEFCTFKGAYASVKVRHPYKLTTLLLTKEIQDYDLDLRGRKTCRSDRGKTLRAKAKNHKLLH